jgi:hypothetical protein
LLDGGRHNPKSTSVLGQPARTDVSVEGAVDAVGVVDADGAAVEVVTVTKNEKIVVIWGFLWLWNAISQVFQQLCGRLSQDFLSNPSAWVSVQHERRQGGAQAEGRRDSRNFVVREVENFHRRSFEHSRVWNCVARQPVVRKK